MQQWAQLKCRCYSCKTQPGAGCDSQSQSKHIPESGTVRERMQQVTNSFQRWCDFKEAPHGCITECLCNTQPSTAQSIFGSSGAASIKANCTIRGVTAHYTIAAQCALEILLLLILSGNTQVILIILKPTSV